MAATDLKIAERIGKAVADGFEEDPSPERMYQRLLTIAAGLAAGLGDGPLVCEEHFVGRARTLYRYASQPPIVTCRTCGQRNRLKSGPSSLSNPICRACKTPLLPGVTAFLDNAEKTPSSSN